MHYSTLAAVAATHHADLLRAACLDRAGAYAVSSGVPQRPHPLAAWVSTHLPRRRSLSEPCISC